jgi:cellulose synthase/poly-beta-1,6-N-acetylglucosamine synthase-like glycosyltransferase
MTLIRLDQLQGSAPALAPAPSREETLGVALLRAGLVDAGDMVQVLALQSRRRGKLADILLARRMVAPERLYRALADHWETEVVDPAAEPPDVRLIDAAGATRCLRAGLLPWRNSGGITLVATARPEDFAGQRDWLEAVFGRVGMVVAPAEAIEDALLKARGARLARAAELRVRPEESCRDLGGEQLVAGAAFLAFSALALATLAPLALWSILLGWAVLTLLLTTGLRLAAALAAERREPPAAPPPIIARLPIVSVMVALYRETDIVPRLVRRLGRLDYPQELLDIVLVVEEDDAQTRAALAEAELPPWMRVVVAPEGRIKTKPRALNFALDHCRGSLVGVYDAEDAPEPDQIRKVVERFHTRGSEVACLQGVLDFYNPHTNWLSRCFTIEYATWFRLVLPGLERLGMPIPLGGTTLFFRREALEELGGWDAHNVTEDADLGMRLARRGYRTEMIETVTHEEANCRPLAWVRQRSRWIKGYMMTWATHMRDPGRLWRDLGPWRFAGFQVLFLATLSQFLLLPVLWSFWLVPLGVPHPVAAALPGWAFLALTGLFVMTEAVNITLGVVALRRSGQRISPLWVPTLHVYFPLAALAAYKAAREVLSRPFYWDKTQHGRFDPPEG